MIKIKIFKAGGKINGYEISGHSGYAERGQDIICASVSTMAGSCHLGLEKVLGLNVQVEIDEEKGYFSLMILENSEQAQILLKTFEESVRDLALQYKKFIKLEIIGG